MDAPAPADHRAGIAAGLGAYGLWGLFPLVFHQLDSVDSFEVVLHRIVWSLVLVLVVLWARHRLLELGPVVADRRRLGLLALAAVLIAVNWLTYVWAVAHGHVVEAALGYYITPLISVAVGVTVLHERLRTAQTGALGFGALAVAVLTAAYGRLPWIALVLATSFAAYGYLKKRVDVAAVPSLAVETAVLAPAAVVALTWLEATGDAAFLNGSGGRDVLLVSLGAVTTVPLVLFATAAARIPLSLLGLLQYVTPTLQLLCGVVLLDEDLPPERLAGFVLVWFALALLGSDAFSAGRRRRRELAAAAVPPPA